MIPLSIIIPTKNDAANLSACLPLLTDFDDVQIVDSGSTDETAEVAAKWGRSIVQFRWNGAFPKKRNWALRNLTFKYPWVLFLDADERMTENWKREAAAFLASAESERFAVVKCYYDNWFMGRILHHGDPMQKTAMARVGAAEYERIEERNWSKLDMEIHEHLQVGGEGVRVGGGIGVGVGRWGKEPYEIRARMEHHDRRPFASYRAKHEQYAQWEANRYRELMRHPERWDALTARQKQKYGNLTRWWLAWAYFGVAYVVKRGFLDGWAGLRLAWFKRWYFGRIREIIRDFGDFYRNFDEIDRAFCEDEGRSGAAAARPKANGGRGKNGQMDATERVQQNSN